MKYIVALLLSIVLFTGCGNDQVDLSIYKKNITKTINLDNSCKYLYNRSKPTVAVVNFTNNSNFGVANINNKNSDASVGIGFSIIGVGAGVKSSKSKTVRVVDPKLASAFIPSIENMILDTGGAKLFTRSDMNKVDAELKLQDSGLLDPKSVVDFGLQSGVQYIITGSIDYVKHNFKNYTQYTSKIANATMYSNNDNLKMAAAAVHLATSFLDGTKIQTGITIKMIDVATGGIIFTKSIKSETKLNSKSKPTYDQLVGAVKQSINEVLPQLKTKLLEQFSLEGYITKIKQYQDDDIVVQINLGKDDNIKIGDKFVVQDIDISVDPLTMKKSCELLDTKLILKATQHISKTHTWTIMENGNNLDIKLLQIVKKVN